MLINNIYLNLSNSLRGQILIKNQISENLNENLAQN